MIPALDSDTALKASSTRSYHSDGERKHVMLCYVMFYVVLCSSVMFSACSVMLLCFHFFMRQTVEASPLQDDLVFFQICTRQKTIFRCVVTLSRHSYRNTVSLRPREDPQSRKPSFDKVQESAMIIWLFLFLRPLTPVSADP